jgi:HAD superfamily hydrolase (TIGR01457 family)
MKTGYLLDMDGVLYRGHEPIPGAADFLRDLDARGIPFLLLTNHACLTPQQFQRKLAGMGIRVPAGHIFSSAQATALWLRKGGARTVFAIGETGLRTALRKCDIRCSARAPSHVVVGLDRHVSYDQLTVAHRLIARGCPFIGTNPDLTYPLPDGPAPECGWLLAALQATTGRAPVVIGKPSRVIFQFAARELGLPARALTMIGDRLDTDILGGQRAGMKTVLVLTGHTTAAMARRSPVRPDRVAASLQELIGQTP